MTVEDIERRAEILCDRNCDDCPLCCGGGYDTECIKDKLPLILNLLGYVEGMATLPQRRLINEYRKYGISLKRSIDSLTKEEATEWLNDHSREYIKAMERSEYEEDE